MNSFQNHPLRDTVSKRCSNLLYDEFLVSMLGKANKDLYHPETNPAGIVNLTTSANALYGDVLRDRLRKDDILQYDTSHQPYFTFYGMDVLRDAAASFATDYFKAVEPLHSDNFIVTSGVSGGMEMLAHVLADPGDVFLLPTPGYSRIINNFRDRPEVDVMQIPLSSEVKHEETKPWQLTANKVEEAIKAGRKQEKRIKGLILVNPCNPTGKVLSKETMVDILQVCKKYQLHVISDEIYGLSAWSQDMDFTSVVGIEDLPDPMRTHLLFGISKDFGLPGFRIGFVHSWNPVVVKALQTLGIFSCIPSSIQHAGATLLNDRDWLNNIFFPECHCRTREAYKHASDWMQKLGIPFHPAEGTFFIFGDLRKFLSEETKEAELELFNDLMVNHKLCVCPGSILHSPEPGWFRIVFTVPREIFDEGMKRLQKCLQTRK